MKPCIKTKFYIRRLNHSKMELESHLRTITWIGKKTFEYKHGFGLIKELKRNPDKKSKVKFIKLEVV